MPEIVIGRSNIHENQTRLLSSLIALLNIASQFDNLLESRVTASKTLFVGLAAGGRQQAQVETKGTFK